jgi:hypothetical protein
MSFDYFTNDKNPMPLPQTNFQIFWSSRGNTSGTEAGAQVKEFRIHTR